MTAVASGLSERFVSWLWRRQRFRGPLVCDDGRTVQIVYPGRAWGEGQPDFQGALIAWPDGRVQRGDVEIHVGSRDWWQHGHQHDPAYRNVILHVVLQSNLREAGIAVLGQRIPTLALEPHLSHSLDLLQVEFECDHTLSPTPCQVGSAEVAALIERAGLKRFGDRADRLEGDLAVVSPTELLWRGVARAFGYTRNADAMVSLAEQAPLADVGTLIDTASGDAEETVFGALLGIAGLLPHQRGLQSSGLFEEALEHAWERAQQLGWSRTGGLIRWETRRVRPGNHPVRRLAGLAVLAVGFHRAVPLAELARIVLDDPRPARALVRYFAVRAPIREWGGLVDLERVVDPPVAGLVGRARAAEIVVNAVLPLLHALGRYWDQRDLEEASLEVYRSFPRIAANGLVRGMAEQIAGPHGLELADTACRQQGLLHIFRTTCDRHACAECIFSGAGARG